MYGVQNTIEARKYQLDTESRKAYNDAVECRIREVKRKKDVDTLLGLITKFK